MMLKLLLLWLTLTLRPCSELTDVEPRPDDAFDSLCTAGCCGGAPPPAEAMLEPLPPRPWTGCAQPPSAGCDIDRDEKDGLCPAGASCAGCRPCCPFRRTESNCSGSSCELEGPSEALCSTLLLAPALLAAIWRACARWTRPPARTLVFVSSPLPVVAS